VDMAATVVAAVVDVLVTPVERKVIWLVTAKEVEAAVVTAVVIAVVIGTLMAVGTLVVTAVEIGTLMAAETLVVTAVGIGTVAEIVVPDTRLVYNCKQINV